MVKPNFWIDKTPKDSSQIAGTQLTQSDRWSSAVITEQVDATNVAAHLAESTEPDVVVPSESGVSAIGATVRAFRDSSGRVTHVSIPDSIPEGASTFSVGVTGEWLASLDATTAATQAQLDAAQQELDAARARLNDPETGLDAVQSRANDAVRDAAQAMVDASNAALAAVPPFIQADTPSAAVVGQLWFPLDGSGRVIGMKRANATGNSGWKDYLLMAGKILVPGSVGTTEIGPDGVTAPNIKASAALWAKMAEFVQVTTQMLKAGNVQITEELLANVITGIIIRGGLFEAGGGSLPMVRIGPLSGQVGVGDTYGVQITTPNNSSNGRALLAVSPAGPYLEFYDGTGKQVLAADKTGVRVINQTSGGMVDISRLAANTSSWSTNDPNFKVQFATSPSGTSPWSSASFFRKQWAGIDIGAVTTVNTPTGKLMIQSGVYIDQPSTVPSASQPGISVQWGIYDQDPTGRAWDQWANNLVGESGRAECNHLIGGMGSRTNGAEIVNLTPNKTYWVAPIYWTANMGTAITRRIFSLWVSCNPIT